MGYLHQSQRVFTPLSQARLEHVDVVRLKKGGCRFEIACYKNKLVEWRRGSESNLEDVLQSQAIFENVSRGKRARDEDIQRVFGTQDVAEVAIHIMTTGEVQVSESIRAAEQDSMLQQIASIIANTCVNPDISRPYQKSAIEEAIKMSHVDLAPHQPVDQPALDVIQRLQQVMPIARAMMKVQVTVASVDVRFMQTTLESLGATILEQEGGANGSLRCICMIEPGKFRAVKAFVKEHARRRFFQLVEVIYLDGDGVGLRNAPPFTEQAVAAPALPPVPAAVVAPAASTRPCSTCGGNFADAAQHREHFRSQWHRYNLKLKAKQEPPVDEASFLALDDADVQRVFDALD